MCKGDQTAKNQGGLEGRDGRETELADGAGRKGQARHIRERRQKEP